MQTVETYLVSNKFGVYQSGPISSLTERRKYGFEGTHAAELFCMEALNLCGDRPHKVVRVPKRELVPPTVWSRWSEFSRSTPA